MQIDRHQRIAFFGMGLMGSRMASRLLQAGFQVDVWNRSPEACEMLFDLGAGSVNPDLSGYHVLLLCLADDHAVQAVFEQFRSKMHAGQIVVDFSSLSVHATQQLATQAAQLGVHWIDSPVSGGTVGAEQGSLVIFAGGERDIIDRLMPIYDVLAQRVTCMGAVGTGQATKICNQLIVAANSTLIAEAVALAKHAGVDAHLLAPALAGGFADSKPLQILAPRMAAHIFEPVQWKVQTLSKDLNNAVHLAQQLQLNIPVAQRALQQLSAHQQQGAGEADLASIIQFVEGQHA